MSLQVDAFYRSRVSTLRALKARKYLVCLGVFVAVLFLASLCSSVAILLIPHFRELVCVCMHSASDLSYIIDGLARTSQVLVEVCYFLFFNYQLSLLRVKTRYWLKQELILLSGLWIFERAAFLVLSLLFDCNPNESAITIMTVAHWAAYGVDFLMVFVAVVLPLLHKQGPL